MQEILQKKIDVRDLEPGMYISALDRPWLETPFLFQGFYVKTFADIREVQMICDYVFIDIVRGKDVADSKTQRKIYTSLPKISPSRSYIYQVELEEEIVAAHKIRKSARQCIDKVFDDIRHNRDLDMDNVKQVVASLVESIIRNPDAQMCLAQLKSRDEYTAQHSINVCVLTVTFGRYLGMDERSLEMIGLGALLHDIGKIRTPLEVLNKPYGLTEEEQEILKQHPVEGCRILREGGYVPDSVLDIVYAHHERLSGEGYPEGVTAEHISRWSKIVAIVDVYDATTSDRSYHDGICPTKALTEMYETRASEFDPELLEKFIQCIGIYPIGTLVELSSGEVAFVLSMNPDYHLKPKVLVVLDKDKNPYYPTRIVNLAERQDSMEGEYGVKQVLEPGSYNVDIRDHLAELYQGREPVADYS